MVNIEDWPLVGKLVTAGTLALDQLIHGGSVIFDVVIGTVLVAVGQPEMLIGLFSVLNRLTGVFGFLPTNLLQMGVKVLLVALAVTYLARLTKKATQKS